MKTLYIPTVSASYAAQITLGSCANTTECVDLSVSVSATEVSVTDIQVFPSTASEFLTIEFPDRTRNFGWILYHLQGQVISGNDKETGLA